jgi:hypothetical protein
MAASSAERALTSLFGSPAIGPGELFRFRLSEKDGEKSGGVDDHQRKAPFSS